MPPASCWGARVDASWVRARAMVERWLFMVRSSARMSLTFADASEAAGTAGGGDAAPGALLPIAAAWGFSSWEGCGAGLLQGFMPSREPVLMGGWSSSLPWMVASVAEARKGSQLMRWVAPLGGTTGR